MGPIRSSPLRPLFHPVLWEWPERTPWRSQMRCAGRGGSRRVSPTPPPTISGVTVLLTSEVFWFIPWRGDFIFITAPSAVELE